MQVTIDHLVKIFPTTPGATLEQYVAPINKTLKDFGLDSLPATAVFLAQIGHESANLTTTSENLNYSEQGLLNTFGKYFNATQAKVYAHDKIRIANRVYANRGGNGDEVSGDGWKFRGAGAIQITFKSGHQGIATYLGITLDEATSYLHTPEGAVYSGGIFFKKNNLIELAKAGDMITTTKRINGGTNGMQARVELYHTTKIVLT